jgi:glycyl-tRNA synthetase beta chain
VKKIEKTTNYENYLKSLIAVNPAVENFFKDVLVMDKDEKVKENRLALLTLLKEKYEYLTDFSKL